MADITNNYHLAGGRLDYSWAISLDDVTICFFEKDVPEVEMSWYLSHQPHRPLTREE